MTAAPVALLDEPERLRLALPPLRRRLLERLRAPGSATGLAAELGLPRQRLNYHLRALERAGLLELVEERQRRGCVERILVAAARDFVVDPAVLGDAPARAAATQDRFASEHLIAASAGTVRQVARMRARASEQGRRLLTFTIETEVRLAEPADLERFSDALARRIGETVKQFDTPRGGRRYRVVAGGHPAPRRVRGGEE
jgi:DNA-binding transcriptional ArsR family regulator